MIDLTGIIVASLCLLLSVCFLNGLKVNYRSLKTYLIVVFYIVLVLIELKVSDRAFKPFYNYIIYLLAAHMILESDFKKSFLTTNFIYVLLMLIDLVILLFASEMLLINSPTALSLKKCLEIINTSSLYSFIINVIGSCALLIITSRKKIYSIYNKLYDLMQGIKAKRIGFIISSVIVVCFATYAIICYSNNIFLTVFMFVSIVLILIYISIRNFKVMTEYEEAKNRYSSVENSLIEYEEMLDKYRVNNHENKNQLLTIQNMIKNKDKKVNEYIDNLVGTVYMTNEKIMMDVSKIPAGGLRATIHAKLNIMDNKKIKYNLDIDRKLRTVDIEAIRSNVKLKISNIVSIFIDNAIDEVESHEDKIVNISMYIEDDKLIIEVTNRFKNQFDPNKMFDKRYTTKKEGHGYGLALAKELIDCEDTLSNFYKIEDNIFTQVLEIKIKRH